MTEQTAALTTVQKVDRELSKESVSSRLMALMPERKAARFKSTLLQIVANNRDLQKCSAPSIVGAAVQAAQLGLDISPSFGFAAIVPYNNTVKKVVDGRYVETKVMTATFQVMVNGWTQLAIRSGQYAKINVTPIYADELEGMDILFSEPILKTPPENGYRARGQKDMIIGYLAAYRLKSGAEKSIYWSIRDIEVFARTYSKSYKRKHPLPIPDGWKPDLFSTGIGWEAGWDAMARKTLLKQLLRKWGPLSTEMEDALESDQASFDDSLGGFAYVDGIDNETGRDTLSAPEDEDMPSADVEDEGQETSIGDDEASVKALFR